MTSIFWNFSFVKEGYECGHSAVFMIRKKSSEHLEINVLYNYEIKKMCCTISI